MKKSGKLMVVSALLTMALASSSAFAYTDATSTALPALTTVTKGPGFDVYNETGYEISFKLNNMPFNGVSPAHSYGTIGVPWGVIKLGCLFKTVCPVEITWHAPGNPTVNTTINTQTGIVGGDATLDPSMPSLNAAITAQKLALKAALSNEQGGVSGRDGYELVTVSPK